MAGVIHICGVIFYAFFASGELQPWAEPPKDEESMQMEQTQLGPSGPEGYYDQQMGGAGAYAGQTTWDTNTQAQYQAAATWDEQQQAMAGAGNANNPFGSAAGAYDPNAAWDDGAATANGYANGNAGDAFYETRAQYVQPTSTHNHQY